MAKYLAPPQQARIEAYEAHLKTRPQPSMTKAPNHPKAIQFLKDLQAWMDKRDSLFRAAFANVPPSTAEDRRPRALPRLNYKREQA